MTSQNYSSFDEHFIAQSLFLNLRNMKLYNVLPTLEDLELCFDLNELDTLATSEQYDQNTQLLEYFKVKIGEQ